MLTWFEKNAPIRTKFNTLLAIYGGLSGLALLASIWASYGGGAVAIGIASACFLATLVVAVVSRERVCQPYVNTVVRMEGLAAGDLDSPIGYMDHEDCVGRMTKAMTTFRQNAIAVAEAAASQQKVVSLLTEGLSKLAANDLAQRYTEPFPSGYEELRHNFNNALDAMSQALGAVTNAVSNIASGSEEIRAASDNLAMRTEQQAAALEETNAAMNRVTSMVQENARSATQVSSSITDAHSEASEGGRVVGQAVEAMGAIQRSSQEITSIINVIDGIAFQTNLLALNAGVEAARAGDAGKGFAVVANEVRALAQRSADAAKEIKVLITKSTEQVEEGVNLVGETGRALDEIVSRVADVKTVVSQISALAEQQARDLESINASVSQMDKMTQQNAAMVEESTAAARSLADEAVGLNSLVSVFRINDNGQPAARVLPHAGRSRSGARNALSDAAAQSRPREVGRIPATAGSLALKADPEQDWSEF